MPRYRYLCENCKKIQIVFHRMSEKAQVCKFCNSQNKMKKLLTTPNIVVGNEAEPNIEVGELTNEYIESNREILEQQKQQAKEETYEPS